MTRNIIKRRFMGQEVVPCPLPNKDLLGRREMNFMSRLKTTLKLKLFKILANSYPIR